MKQFTKQRRRLRLGLLLLCVSLLPAWLWPAYERRSEGWSSLVPTTIAIACASLDNEQSELDRIVRLRGARFTPMQIRLYGALHAPMSMGRLSQTILVRDVWVRGDPIPIAVNEFHDQKYGPEGHRLNAGFFAFALDVFDENGDRLLGSRESPEWWPRLTRVHPGAARAEWDRSYATLPACDEEACTYRVRVIAESTWVALGCMPSAEEERVKRSAEEWVEITVRTVEPGRPGWEREIVDVFDDEATRAWIRSNIRLVLNGGRSTSWMVGGVLRTSSINDAPVLSIELDVLDDDHVIWSGTAYSELMRAYGLPEHENGQDFPQDALVARVLDIDDGSIDPGDLQIRIRSRVDLGMGDLWRDCFWQGEIVGPFRDFFECHNRYYSLVPDGSSGD